MLNKRKHDCVTQESNAGPSFFNNRPPTIIDTTPLYEDKRARHERIKEQLPDINNLEFPSFNAYITFPTISSLVAALAGLDVFHFLLGPDHAHLDIKAVGLRSLGQGNKRVVIPVLHMHAGRVMQVHQNAQDVMLEHATGRFPLLGMPRGFLVGDLCAVNNVSELYYTGAKLLGLDAGSVSVVELEEFRRQKATTVINRFFSH